MWNVVSVQQNIGLHGAHLIPPIIFRYMGQSIHNQTNQLQYVQIELDENIAKLSLNF